MPLLLGMMSHLFRHLWFFKPLQKSHSGARDKAQGPIQHCFSALTIRYCGIDTFAANVSRVSTYTVILSRGLFCFQH